MEKLNIEDTKKLLNNIMDLNKQAQSIRKTLLMYSKQYGIDTIINKNNRMSKINFVDKVTVNDCIRILKQEILEDDKELESYFLSAKDGELSPGPELSFALDRIIDNYILLENMLFEQYGPSALCEIWRHCYNWQCSWSKSRHDLEYKQVPIEDTCFKLFRCKLDIIWDKYKDDLYNKAKRSPKRMLIFFFLFQEKFTDRMFNTLMSRLKKYDDKFLINYVLQCSRYLPIQYKNILESNLLLEDLKN